MSTKLAATAKKAYTRAEVKAMLREIGYILWLARTMANEIKAERCEPVRPEMAEFCAIDMAACAA